MGKYERIQRRREKKEGDRSAKKIHDKEVKRIEQEKKMATWRKDSHGNYIFRGAFKISPLAAIGLIAFAAILIFFTVAIILNDETAAECANPFCHMLGIGEEGDVKYAPPTSGMTEERELP